MSVASILEDIGGDLVKAANAIAKEWVKVKAGWDIISSPQVRAIILTIAADAIKTVKDTETALTSGGVNMTLDTVVVADIKQLLADAKSGEGVIVADLKALNIAV